MEDKLLPEEQFTNTNIQLSVPGSSQEPLCNEGALELKSSKPSPNELAAKTLHVDDTMIVKTGIERGESVPRSELVRKMVFKYYSLEQWNIEKVYSFLYVVSKSYT